MIYIYIYTHTHCFKDFTFCLLKEHKNKPPVQKLPIIKLQNVERTSLPMVSLATKAMYMIKGKCGKLSKHALRVPIMCTQVGGANVQRNPSRGEEQQDMPKTLAINKSPLQQSNLT